LGNLGRKYDQTRHNVGFEVLDRLAERLGDGSTMDKFDGRLMEARIGSERMLLLWPHTFMNRSGDAVAAISRYYDIATTDLLVVVDEVALPFGRLRARARGSAGGHNGLKSIIERIGTTEFSRLRLGVGRGDDRKLADHVLSIFERSERAELETFITRAADAAEMFAAEGILKVMNTYNPETADPELD
jgi:PTH1 family peptidyl-tRNA hydrolase